MEMKRLNSGKLRAVGYEPRERRLRVELDNGQLIDYSGVGEEVWRRLSSSGSPWSYYRDNIEEDFPGQPASAKSAGAKRPNPLDDLFRK